MNVDSSPDSSPRRIPEIEIAAGPSSPHSANVSPLQMSIVRFQRSVEYFGSEFYLLLLSSLPLILNNISQVLLPVISLYFCGRMGSSELAAVTISNTFVNIAAYANILGLSSACDTLFPQYFGGADKMKVGLVLQKGLLISILSYIPLASFLLNVRYLIAIFIKEQIIIDYADQYIQALLPAVLLYSVHIILQKYLQSQNIFYPVLIINLISTIICFGASHVFINQFNLGITGAALGVVAANIFILVAVFGYIIVKRVHKQTWPGWTIQCLYGWKDYLKLAVPGLGMLLFEWSNFEIGVIAAGLLGKIEISVMSIGIQTIYLLFMIPLGIATSANIRVGQLLGSNQPAEAKNSCRIATTLNVFCSLISFTTVFLLSNYIPYAFTTEKEIIDQASYLLKFVAFCHLMDASQGFAGGIFRAVGAQIYAFIMIFISFYLIGIPIGIYLMLYTKLRVLGFWIGFFISASLFLIQQLIFIVRIDWNETARIIHERSLHKLDNERSSSSSSSSMNKEPCSSNETDVAEVENGEKSMNTGNLLLITRPSKSEHSTQPNIIINTNNKLTIIIKKLFILLFFLTIMAASLSFRLLDYINNKKNYTYKNKFFCSYTPDHTNGSYLKNLAQKLHVN